MAKNEFEGLYRAAVADEDLKSGAYYERLVAVVTKVLSARSVVIHDIRLRGKDTGVKHQIDVKVDRDGQPYHLLLECKDFTQREGIQNKVGLEVARSFFGVCDDVKPDEAAIVSATGFTRDAIKYVAGKPYAGARQIKLMVVRQFVEADWDGRIREIYLRFIMPFLDATVQPVLHKDRLTEEQQPIVAKIRERGASSGKTTAIRSAAWGAERTLGEMLDPVMAGEAFSAPEGQTEISGVFEMPEDAEILLEGHWLPLRRIGWSCACDVIVEESVIGADRVADLVCQMVGGHGTDDDRPIWRDELESWRFNPNTREVEPIEPADGDKE